MAKRRKRDNRYSRGGNEHRSPLFHYAKTRPTVTAVAPSVIVRRLELFGRSARQAGTRRRLDHTVSPRDPHQYAHLMRTVLRDTRLPRRAAVRQAAPAFHTRALARLRAWPTLVANPWTAVSRGTPLHRSMICAKRGIRREVLFALNQLNGAGSGGRPKSKVKC